MKYEIDFIGIKEETQDADAICFRYYDERQQRYIVCIYDGGLKSYGSELKNHLNKYYFSNMNSHKIDYVICSHSDQDHVSGLTEILENFDVSTLIMNRPWRYARELYDYVDDRRRSIDTVSQRLKDSYPAIYQLEEIANKKGVSIQEGFQGTKIGDFLTILSPSKKSYLDLLKKSDKTPLQSEKWENFSRLDESIQLVSEIWEKDLLPENVHTTEENEMSIVLFGNMGEEKFLLTGDAGIQSLTFALDYAEKTIGSLQLVNFYQIPHHGSRHNISPSVLNRMVGPILPKGVETRRTAFVSVALGSDHPKKMVTNAYIRRGIKVYKTEGATMRHYYGDMPCRGWASSHKLPFFHKVES